MKRISSSQAVEDTTTRGNDVKEQENRSLPNMTIWLITVVAARMLQRMIINRVLVAVEAVGVHPHEPNEPDVMFMRRRITLVNVHQICEPDVTTGKYPPHRYPSPSL